MFMKGIFITVLVILAVASAIDSGIWHKLVQKIAHPKLQVNPAPSTEADIAEVVKGNTDFAFDLFKTIKADENPENIIFSPYSISVAMGMTFAGAHGSTERQMKSTLHFDSPNTHAVFRDLRSKIIRYGGPEVKMANSLWCDKDYEFNQDYVDLVRNVYKGEARSVDFKNESDVARKEINEWTASKTQNMIQNVVDSELSPSVRLVLVNAIYFKAGWQHEFTTFGKDRFTLLNGEVTEAEMMKDTTHLHYLEGSGFRAVSLPYRDNQAFMTVILPDEGKFAEVKKNLNTEILTHYFDNAKWRSVKIRMPKFNIKTDLKLKDNLKTLGLDNPFTSDADFSRMDGTRNLMLQDVIHKAVIGVNEAGTEASAATVIAGYLSSPPKIEVEFIVNRPFIYVIHNKGDRSVLFMGQVVKPSF